MCQNETKWSPKIKQYLYFVSLPLIGFISANKNAVFLLQRQARGMDSGLVDWNVRAKKARILARINK